MVVVVVVAVVWHCSPGGLVVVDCGTMLEFGRMVDGTVDTRIKFGFQ